MVRPTGVTSETSWLTMMSLQETVETFGEDVSRSLESGRIEEQEILMIRSLQGTAGLDARASYNFSGVVLSAMLENVSRGDRFNGRFSCRLDSATPNGTDAASIDESGILSLTLGPYSLQNAGPLSLQRLVTPRFFRIAIRCDEMSGAGEDVGRFNLTFYSDPRFCDGNSFTIESLNIAHIPMPSLYIETSGGAPLVSAKLQTLLSE